MVKKYIIMAGGNYRYWETPRHLTEICGETLIDRTIRLLRKNGIKDISISSNNSVFKQFGLPVLNHTNSYDIDSVEGKWYDAFYLTDEPVCYIFGDVVFSPEAIKKIVEKNTIDIDLFGSMPPFADNYFKDHIEAFALKVNNPKHLKKALEKTKQLDAKHKFWRKPLIWELWTVIKDVPLQTKPDDYIYNYTAINDYTCDIDRKGDIVKIQMMMGGIEMVKVEAIGDFTLARYGEVAKSLVRKGQEKEGMIYTGDIFTCSKDLADYLLGGNRYGTPFVKVIEIIPTKKETELPKEEKKETPKKPIKKTTKKISKK